MNNGRISKNFRFAEFEASEMAARYRIINVITDWGVRDNIIALVREVLQPLRDAWGKPLVINSGYRCPKLNKAVGGVAESQHVKGEAADVACDSPQELARTVVRLGLDFDQMIVYPTFVHLSHTEEKVNRRQILYSHDYKGEEV